MLCRARNHRVVVALIALGLSPAVYAQETPSGIDLPAVSVEQFLPVKTQALTVGQFEPETRQTGVSQPFFLIGCDDLSLAWVQANHERLVKLGAFGLVIDAPNVAAYRRLESTADGLIVRPVNGDLIAQHLGVRHYPALITADGIFP
jgi:integrating conjugative element protein (TIGR03765 family)